MDLSFMELVSSTGGAGEVGLVNANCSRLCCNGCQAGECIDVIIVRVNVYCKVKGQPASFTPHAVKINKWDSVADLADDLFDGVEMQPTHMKLVYRSKDILETYELSQRSLQSFGIGHNSPLMCYPDKGRERLPGGAPEAVCQPKKGKNKLSRKPN